MINRVIRLLVFSDFMIYFALGLLGPIFAVFILDNIAGSSLRVVGIATACYWLSRTVVNIPLARFMDRTDGERDEFYFLIIGLFIISSVPLFYLLVRTPLQLYVIQLIYGISGAMASSGWLILFTDHIDRGRVGYEWSLENVGMGIATAASAFIGATLADRFGFPIVLILLSIMGYVSTILVAPLYREAKTLKEIKRSGRWKSIQEKRKSLPGDKLEEPTPIH